MTPKEKAINLIHKFCSTTDGYYKSKKNLANAKQCALIAVNEIITSLRVTNLYCAGENNINDCIKHWQEVKTEIEAL
jgi:hypothetical protein